MAGLAVTQQSSAMFAEMGAQAERSLNTGWVADQRVDGAGGFVANVTPSSSSLFFFSTGDATAFYLPGRRAWVLQGGLNIFGDIISSSCASTPTLTQVTIGNFLNSTGLSTGAITSVSLSPTFPSTGAGAGNEIYAFGTQLMITTWGA